METLTKEGNEKALWILNAHATSKLILRSYRCKIFSPKYYKLMKIENYKKIHWTTASDCSKTVSKYVWKDTLIKLLHSWPSSWMQAGSRLLCLWWCLYVWNKDTEVLVRSCVKCDGWKISMSSGTSAQFGSINFGHEFGCSDSVLKFKL